MSSPTPVGADPGGEPASPLANGGAFGGKRRSPVPDRARPLADEPAEPVRVLWRTRGRRPARAQAPPARDRPAARRSGRGARRAHAGSAGPRPRCVARLRTRRARRRRRGGRHGRARRSAPTSAGPAGPRSWRGQAGRCAPGRRPAGHGTGPRCAGARRRARRCRASTRAGEGERGRVDGRGVGGRGARPGRRCAPTRSEPCTRRSAWSGARASRWTTPATRST